MNQKLRILIIEDEEAIRNGLIDVFIYHGFDADSAAEGPEGLQKALTGTFDMILLDVMLPGLNGFDICNRIREQDKDQPIIMLTAKTSDEDIVHGLTLGADDYVAKPFSVAQLVLRVQAVLRRSRSDEAAQHFIRLSDVVEIDILNLSGTRNDEPLSFTRREMEIIEYLYKHRERPVSREELLNKVWGYAKNADIETRTVDIHIAKLRRKIEADSAEPRFLTTVRGAGYRLLVD
ncbi:MAG: response regulator transcription factor [Candidatus Thiodiazotropha sp.]|jgi:two-component system response regulator RegX3